MRGLEQAPVGAEGLEFDFGMDFDINVAFQDAMQEVATSTELALEEKVRRMEVIVTEGSSEVYRDFVDFRQLAAQMELMCAHDHALSEQLEVNEPLSAFRKTHKEDGRSHEHGAGGGHAHEESSTVTGKRSKKKGKKKPSIFSIIFSGDIY